MNFIFCIVLYLTQLRLSHQIDLPDRLSEILYKLIEATENKNDGKTNTFNITKPSNQSKIIYVKAKSDPNVIWEVKYQNITNRSIEVVKENATFLEDNIDSKYHGSLDHVGYVDAMNPREVTKNDNIKNIPKSSKYKLKSKLQEQEKLNDPYEYKEVASTERSRKIQHKTSSNKYSTIDNDINKFSHSFLSNLTKLLTSKKDDDLNTLKLNKNYEKLLKEIHDIKESHKKENLKSGDEIYLREPSLQHHHIALKPFPYIPILLNYHLISNVDVLPTRPIAQQSPYYRRYLATLGRYNV